MVDKAGVRLVQTIYNTTYFVDLQYLEGELIGYPIQQLPKHLEYTYIDIDDLEDEINDNEATLNLTYDPNEAPEMYWNRLQQCQMTAADLQEKITDNRVMRVSITHFRDHADLTDDTIDWKKKPVTDRKWNNFKKHFGKAIRRNKKDKGTFSKLGIANDAIESNVSAIEEAAILQSKTISALQTELATIKAHRPDLQQMANSSTTTPPGGMINMMVEDFKLAQPNSVMSDGSNIKYVKLAQPNSVISYKSKSKRAEWTKDQKNDATGKRKNRRYTHDNYCYRCGYDVNHTSATCKWIKPKEQENHQPTSTADNPMGVRMRNMHLHT